MSRFRLGCGVRGILAILSVAAVFVVVEAASVRLGFRGIFLQPFYIFIISITTLGLGVLWGGLTAVAAGLAYMTYIYKTAASFDALFEPYHLLRWGVFLGVAVLTVLIFGFFRRKYDRLVSQAEERQLQARFQHDQVVLKISNLLLNGRGPDLKTEINTALEWVGETLDLDKVFLFTHCTRDKTGKLKYEWCKENVESDFKDFGNPPSRLTFAYSQALYARGEILQINSISDLPPEAADEKEAMQMRGVESCFVVPLRFHGQIIGYLGGDYVRAKPWSKEIIRMFGQLAESMAHALKRNDYEKELLDKTRELEQSNQGLEQFAYICSHDLQEPVRTISLLLQVLQRRTDVNFEPGVRVTMDELIRASQRMLKLIKDLLLYSRTVQERLNIENVSIEEVVQSALFNLRAAIEESEAQIQLGPLPQLRVDRQQFIRVMQNLISNAIKYRKGDEIPQIQISARKEEADWIIRVTDNGIGIEAKYFPKIFQIFQRLHSATDFKGTGIGLTLVKSIVERHQGKVEVSSQLGKGSTFAMYLPAA